MERYAHERNIERFERDLKSEPDPARRRLLETLLSKEKARLADLQRNRDPHRG
jgi:hypothetical protein